MQSPIVEFYSRQAERLRASRQITETQPDFKVYLYEGAAWLLAISRRGNACLTGCIDAYEHYKPVRLNADQLNMLSNWIKERRFKVEQEAI